MINQIFNLIPNFFKGEPLVKIDTGNRKFFILKCASSRGKDYDWTSLGFDECREEDLTDPRVVAKKVVEIL